MLIFIGPSLCNLCGTGLRRAQADYRVARDGLANEVVRRWMHTVPVPLKSSFLR